MTNTTSTTKTATTRRTNDRVRQRAKFGARSSAGDICSCDDDDEQSSDLAQPSRATGEKRAWYESSTGNHQGLIVEEETGRSIAVTYDKADAALIVISHNAHESLIAALEQMREQFNRHTCKYHGPMVCDKCEALKTADEALRQA